MMAPLRRWRQQRRQLRRLWLLCVSRWCRYLCCAGRPLIISHRRRCRRAPVESPSVPNVANATQATAICDSTFAMCMTRWRRRIGRSVPCVANVLRPNTIWSFISSMHMASIRRMAYCKWSGCQTKLSLPLDFTGNYLLSYPPPPHYYPWLFTVFLSSIYIEPPLIIIFKHLYT